MNPDLDRRSDAWRWYVCGLLLLATMINYMDRQVLANTSAAIKRDFGIDNERYGHLEMWFSLAFGVGGLIFGTLADVVGVRFLYPMVLLLWSATGFLTGYVRDFDELVVCRLLLGVFEAGHWPCALKTSQRLFTSEKRGLANSILQSGGSIGAIVTPPLVAMMTTDEPGSWRLPFQVVGIVGSGWLVLWLFAVRKGDVDGPLPEPASVKGQAPAPPAGSFLDVVFSSRYLALLVMVIGINITWHLFRAWLPLFLEQGRGYSKDEWPWINSAYFIAAEVGCLVGGYFSFRLARSGWSPHAARRWVFLSGSVLAGLTTAAAMLPKGPLLVASLLMVGAGLLALFPCYYSFNQELSVKHQGKVSGTLSCMAWTVTAFIHPLFGRYVDETKSYDLGIGIVGWLPLIALGVFIWLWGRPDRNSPAAAGH